MKKIVLLMVLILVLIPLSCLAVSGVDGSTVCGGGSASSGSGGGGGGGSKGRFLTSFSATAELDESAGKIYVSVNLGQAVDSTGFASLYRGNTMVCVQKFNLNAESAEIEFDFDGTYDDFNGEYAIRLFAFDSNLKPIAARCDVQLTDNSTVTINSADIDFDRSELSRLYYYDADNKSRSVKLASTFDFVYNGGEAEKLTADKLFDILGIGKDNTGDIELTLYNADVKCDLIVATEYDYDEIASANELEPGDWRIYFKSGASVTLCYSDAETAISLENTAGKLVLPSELSAGDVVAYYTNGTIRNFTYMKMVKITDCAVEGMVTAINASDNLIWVDDVEYKLSPALNKEFLLGEKYRFYLGMTGKISYFTAPASADEPDAPITSSGFAVVRNAGYTSNLDGDEVFTVKYFSDETEGTLNFDKNSKSLDGSAYSELKCGDVFTFNIGSDNTVTYAVCGKVANGLFKPNADTLKTQCSDGDEYCYGYIANSERQAMTAGENINVYANGAVHDIIVTDSAAQYTYVPRDGEVESGSFAGGYTADYFNGTDNTATMVFIKIHYDDVVAVCSFDTRVNVDGNNQITLNGEAVDTLYIR